MTTTPGSSPATSGSSHATGASASAAGRTVAAARLVEHGQPLEVQQLELAVPAGDEVVVEMAYAGVNPVDRYGALGTVAPDAPVPRTLGVEGTGKVDGRWVLVYGHGLGTTRDGVWADAVVAPKDACVGLPDGVEPQAAAALGVAGATAYRTGHELARVTEDDRVLVLGASGGVGSMIVSLARSIGAQVWGQTGNDKKVAGIESHGATRAVVSDAAGLVDAVRELCPSVVFDPLGGEFTGAAVEAIAPRGRLVLFGTSADGEGRVPLRSLYRKGLAVLGYGGLGEPEDAIRRGIEGALGAVRDGKLVVQVDTVLPLRDVNEAFARLEKRDVAGKLLLQLGT